MTFQKQAQYPIKLSENESTFFTAHHYINRQQDAHLLADFASGKLFQLTHPTTQEIVHVPFPCLFEDEINQFLVFYIPDSSVPFEEISPSLFEGTAGDYTHYTIRLTTHLTEFFEKINILETPYRDTEVECVKLLTHTLFQEQQSDNALGFYFYLHDNIPSIAIATQSGTLTADYKPELVDIVNNKLGEALNLPKGKLFQVNGDWAIEQLDLR